jgi:hypothetical protein
MTGPAVSVLVPAFNDAAYLEAALASISRQSFASFEVIVADDASGDETAALAAAWAARDARFRLVRNDVNLGMTENWNRALREAQAPLVFKLDADDALELEALARLEAAFATTPGLRFAACRAVECDAELAPREPFHGEAALRAAGLDPSHDHVKSGWEWFALSFDDYQLWHSSAQLHRREELLAIGGWDPAWSCASDTDLILRLTATARPVAHVGYVGVRYRRRPGSVSSVFSQQGWKRAEAILVSARALQGPGATLAHRVPRLRRNWWRTWRNVQAIATEASLWTSMPERIRSRLAAVLTGLRPPPMDVQLEGWLRDRLWRLRHRGGTAA